MTANWTKPFHGVQHLKPLKPGWQATVEVSNTGGTATAYVLAPGHGFKSQQKVRP